MCSFIFKINLNQENPVTLEEDKSAIKNDSQGGPHLPHHIPSAASLPIMASYTVHSHLPW